MQLVFFFFSLLLGFSQHFQTHFEDGRFGEPHVCRTLASSPPLRELVGTPSFRERVYSSYSGGMGSEGIDAALYALSSRAAWGRVGHPKEKNLQPHHHEATRLPPISNFFFKARNPKAGETLTSVGGSDLEQQPRCKISHPNSNQTTVPSRRNPLRLARLSSGNPHVRFRHCF